MRLIESAAALMLLASGPAHVRDAPAKAREVEIVAMDYAFRAPATLPAGRTTFRLVNRGKVRHEVNISLLKQGATVQQFMDAMNAGQPVAPFREGPVGVLFAFAGARSTAALSTELQPGRTYVAICIFRDSTGAPRHYAMGMFAAFTVTPATPATAAAAPPVHVDTIVGADYAFVRYPRTVAPGHHSIAFVNEGTVRHEVVMFVLKPGVTLERMQAVEKANGDVDALIESDIGVLAAPAGITPLGHLEVDMLPGREYTIVCTFANDDRSPPHIALGMYGGIRVSGRRTP